MNTYMYKYVFPQLEHVNFSFAVSKKCCGLPLPIVFSFFVIFSIPQAFPSFDGLQCFKSTTPQIHSLQIGLRRIVFLSNC